MREPRTKSRFKTPEKQVMTGNENTWEASVQQLVPPIVASRVRVLPRSRHPRTVFKQHLDNDNNDLPRSFYHHSSKYPGLHASRTARMLSVESPPHVIQSSARRSILAKASSQVVCSEYVKYMFLRYHRISLMTGISMTGHWVF